LAGFIQLPENRSAFAAIADLAYTLKQDAESVIPIFIYGPPGCGKSYLLSAIAVELSGIALCTLSANSFPLPWEEDTRAAERLEQARSCDLLVVEDLQHLPSRATEAMVQLFDERLHRRLPMVYTACSGPGQLQHRGNPHPPRLTARLAGGLVVGMRPLQAESRCVFLHELARHRGTHIAKATLDWLAASITGGARQLEGALLQVEALDALNRKQPDVAELRAHFKVHIDSRQPSLERIMSRVSAYFQVAERLLRSPRRDRSLLMARHVSMYLARQLTRLSLQEIGACFGGRDHTTVLHSCRKVEEVMRINAQLSGAVQLLQAELA
jgi:chromosomal replication initiator protein